MRFRRERPAPAPEKTGGVATLAGDEYAPREREPGPGPDARASEPAPATAPRRRRAPVGWRLRRGGAAAVGTAGAGFVLLARLVMLVATLIALLIGLAIVLRVTGANATNSIISDIHDAANFFAGSANGLYTSHGHGGRELALNWGIAAIVYLLIGGLIASFIRRLGVRGLELDRRHRAAAPPV